MEISEITSIISSVGFPIVMCIILFRYINTTQKELISKLGDISKDISLLCSRIDKNGKDEK